MIARGRRSHRSSGFDGLGTFGEVPLSSKLDGLWLVSGPMLLISYFDLRPSWPCAEGGVRSRWPIPGHHAVVVSVKKTAWGTTRALALTWYVPA